MSERARQAYDEWKQAESSLTKAWDDYFGKRGSPPSADLIQEVSRLRAVANDRLTVAMLMLDPSKPG